ncbi:MAG TPA: D-hexose-6-phosphate mutarotase [Alcaligenaceae bacterium]|nr:D-hexose-6-phosphate mutarotase [Alcaligenaceae bacterium]
MTGSYRSAYMMTSDKIQTSFVHHDHIKFEQNAHGIILLKVDNPFATATISLLGGQVIAWQPKSQTIPVLWEPDFSLYQKGKPIRGGAPICWPWFGPHESITDYPAHGFARINTWEIVSIKTMSSGETEICMVLPKSLENEVKFPYRTPFRDIELSVRYLIGSSLSIELSARNSGQNSISITEALHTYFKISDIGEIEILGLDGSKYIDQIDQHQIKAQIGPIKFDSELDRVYIDTTASCSIRDLKFARTIKISKSGSNSTVIWNPWLTKASKMTDLGTTHWQSMVCVESANAFHNAVLIEPGHHHMLAVNYAVAHITD